MDRAWIVRCGDCYKIMTNYAGVISVFRQHGPNIMRGNHVNDPRQDALDYLRAMARTAKQPLQISEEGV